MLVLTKLYNYCTSIVLVVSYVYAILHITLISWYRPVIRRRRKRRIDMAAGRIRRRESHMVKQQELMVMMMRLMRKLLKRRGRKSRDIITRRPVTKGSDY